ncbi:Tripartite tricarboxylate transporter TctA family protein [Candidatus Methanoperedenaceae archaeon GB37]|nr:Tripartite tricarboxylate transporter TctA family protein [Candidatus Methanoperedenaceae archaeon GB37]
MELFTSLLFAASLLLGFLLGIVTGLIPGIHVNNTAALLLAMMPLFCSYGVPLLCIVIVILANAITHTFIDIIPAVLVGVPEPDTALGVLPGHSMTIEGRGFEAIRLSALGSAGGVIGSLLFILPLAWVFGEFYESLCGYMVWALVGLILVMILSERGSGVVREGSLAHLKYKAFAALVFLASGVLGSIAFASERVLNPPIEIGEGVSLLPVLSGLFGASTLIISMLSTGELPLQEETEYSLSPRRVVRGVFFGSAAGSLVAWFPGVSSAVATIIARLLIPHGEGESESEFIVSLSGANTSNAIFTLLALYVIGRARSGAMVAIDQILTMNRETMLLLFTVISLTALISYPATILIGRRALKLFAHLNYTRLSASVLTLLLSMVILFTGTTGLAIFATAIPIGMLPHYLGVRKSHLMGCILMPVTLYLIG